MPKVSKFIHNKANEAIWTEGLREIFDYRDLGLKQATDGSYVAKIIKANGKTSPDQVQKWHRHLCDFQFLMVISGWAKFEYEGKGVHKLEKGDVVNQEPGIIHREIACSEDFEVLEIVAPADFSTEVIKKVN